MPNEAHVVPVGDRIGHVLDNECVCGPRAEIVRSEDGDGWLVTHHSLDGREVSEATG